VIRLPTSDKVVRYLVVGMEEAVWAQLNSTQGSENAVIITAYVEHFEATLHSQLGLQMRRTRAAATVYNLCRVHRSLGSAGATPPNYSDGSNERWIKLPGSPITAAGRCTSWRLCCSCGTPPELRGERPRWLLEDTHVA
jgi:hypothetical protein